ncbi:hypothetical protein K450DRAFT_263498 [Umbelopsis ramanniana AG]|uniref:Uncharacterized protein n=1 Tax=Umbelopsis ramanniana AG TaxID=1314678 RepID=A0AAD5H765_UMBRA|nr:uncharacterized protein K450DRAFT_263498 [Umbelopsis ramanniana AG]KAI8575055.1 hypothetical protein K450DRAFT_263498 [Umbelopsis ramanniana AG]
MLSKCCFCVDLRTATLLLAVLGAMSHLWSAFAMTGMVDSLENDEFSSMYTGLTLYSYATGLLCLVGAVGVAKNNIKKVRVFSIYYWVELVLNFILSTSFAFVAFSISQDVCDEVAHTDLGNGENMDMDECLNVYLDTASIATVALALNLLLKLHYALAIHSYYNKLKYELAHPELALSDVDVVSCPYTPVATMEKDANAVAPPAYVAGQKFVMDEKN